MASKLLFLPLVPALAFGIVEVASRISVPVSAPTPTHQRVVIQPVVPAPIVEFHVTPPAPPAPPVPPPPCIDCTATA